MYMVKVAKITSHQPVQHALCTTLLGMTVFHIVHGLLVWVSCNGFHLFLPLFLRNLRRRTPDATLLHAFRRCSFLNTLSTVLCSICEIKGWEFLVPIISPPWTKKKPTTTAGLVCGADGIPARTRNEKAKPYTPQTSSTSAVQNGDAKLHKHFERCFDDYSVPYLFINHSNNNK